MTKRMSAAPGCPPRRLSFCRSRGPASAKEPCSSTVFRACSHSGTSAICRWRSASRNPTDAAFAEWRQKWWSSPSRSPSFRRWPALWAPYRFFELRRRGRAEEAALGNEHRYHLLADNSTDMISRTSITGVRRYVSPASFRLFGYTPDELVRQGPLTHPDDLDIMRAAVDSMLAGEETATVVLPLSPQRRTVRLVRNQSAFDEGCTGRRAGTACGGQGYQQEKGRRSGA